MTRTRLISLGIVWFWLIAACGGSASTKGQITVFATASLTDAFREIETAFESAHPATEMTTSFAASSTLAAQINQGAPADVFAAADTANIDKVAVAEAPRAFATNRLQIIVGKGNPRGIRSLTDLARSDVVYVTAAPGVPIATYAQQALERAGVKPQPKSLEVDVKAVVTKVTLGEADAGIVFVTDVIAARDKAAGVAIPDDQNVVATYPIAVLNSARNRSGAEAFVAFVLSGAGQAILAKHGFAQP